MRVSVTRKTEKYEVLTGNNYQQLGEDLDSQFFWNGADFLLLDNYTKLLAVAQSGSEKQRRQVEELTSYIFSPQAEKKAAKLLAALR